MPELRAAGHGVRPLTLSGLAEKRDVPTGRGQGLTDDQVARIVSGSTPHPGASLTEPAALTRPLGEIPTTYVKCLPDAPNRTWNLVTMDTGHWPMFSQSRALARVFVSAVS
ncbi:hypothetical protein [Nocardiopsis sp. FIRDI 009]|uniref:hypothetical protein n=1 Tax=Nocardiopsis sp. FIRDI 009 TaxID=714197 RepID=UPI001E5096CD|nr:hypothetical protein [Nocardiopsis sp. FIRDI 009]